MAEQIFNKNEFTTNLSKKRWYNPNSYTALDASICFILVIVLFRLFSEFGGQFFSFLWKNKIIKDYYLLMCLNVFVSQALIFIIAFAFSKIRKVGMFSGGGYRYRMNGIDMMFGIVLILGITCVFQSTHYQFVDDIYMSTIGKSYDEYYAEYIKNIPTNGNVAYLLLYNFILVPILPAICEEALFRGVITRGYNSYGAFVCVILSSTMFAIMHGSFEQLILQFIGGLAITAVVYITKNFFIGAIMHFTNNLGVYLLEINSRVFEQTQFTNASYVYDAICIVFGIVFCVVGVLYFLNKAMKQFKNKTLNKTVERFDKPCYACLTTAENASEKAEKMEFNDIDFNTLKNSDKLYFNGKSFKKFNRKSIKPLEVILTILGISLAVIVIFTSLSF